MDSSKTAISSGKSTGGSSPFDEIVALEKQEAERTETELEAMRKEKQEVSQALAKKVQQSEEEMKNAAKEELKVFKEKDLTVILNEAENQAKDRCAQLEKKYDAVSQTLISGLTERVLDSKSPLIA